MRRAKGASQRPNEYTCYKGLWLPGDFFLAQNEIVSLSAEVYWNLSTTNHCSFATAEEGHTVSCQHQWSEKETLNGGKHSTVGSTGGHLILRGHLWSSHYQINRLYISFFLSVAFDILLEKHFPMFPYSVLSYSPSTSLSPSDSFLYSRCACFTRISLSPSFFSVYALNEIFIFIALSIPALCWN